MAEARATPPRDFHHPYTPYDIQIRFMNAVYDCIEGGNIGIFESPTGQSVADIINQFPIAEKTDIVDQELYGKSLSLICGSLTWLREHKRKKFEEDLLEVGDANNNNNGKDVGEEPDWIIEHAKEQRRQTVLRRKADVEARLSRIREREKRQRERFEKAGEPPARKKLKGERDVLLSLSGEEQDGDGAQYLLEDYHSEDEGLSGTKAKPVDDGLSAETKELMAKLGMNVIETKEEEEEPEHEDEIKFIHELRRVKMPPALSTAVEPASPDHDALMEEEFKHLTLGSRKNLCINPKVSKLGSATAINERCLDLQQPGTAKESKCPYIPTKENEVLVNDFRDHTLARVRDIEEMGNLGKKIGICPYYGTRSTIKPSEKSAREALGICLKGHIVIIDEAHNLMDAIANIHSVGVSLKQLQRGRTQLTIYLQKFRNRLKGTNRVYVTQLVRLLDSLSGFLQTTRSRSRESMVNMSDLMAGKGVDQINLYKLMRYLQQSKLARKVEGYCAHAEEETAAVSCSSKDGKTSSLRAEKERTIPVLTHIQSFLLALTNCSAEGRIFYSLSEDNNDASLKYMLLDPTHHFRDVVEEARAVILAGGTMSPMSDFMNHLFSYIPTIRIKTLSCGHVIPAENLIACPISKGPGGQEFEFTFEKRNSQVMIDDLGRSILNLCLVIPDGIVVFFPSYAYLEQVVRRWGSRPPSATGSKSLWERMSQHKQIFQETKDKGSRIEETLSRYADAIDAGRGGLLLAVIGGKLSEGINFSDRLGRGVIVVGLPFPNIHSAEWKAKLEHVEKVAFERTLSTATATVNESTNKSKSATQATTAAAAAAAAAAAGAKKEAAREFYETACMRAVNQSIGRAIRHRNDYACILLMDRRYENQRIREKLPMWIQKGMVVGKENGSVNGGGRSFADVMGRLSAFFRAKR
ncbi:MAG: ATP-dependent DNA helicase chl1 [Peltula sp. TS41687]|nr:MAG: ATP-dependent DNA helicase chl1 [Peltula sp. TS41687]